MVVGIRTVYCMALLMASLTLASAENWPHWRGPQYNGSSQVSGLPTSWSKTDNVRWVTPMPGESAATAIVWDDKVFVSSFDEKTDALLALCLDKASGEILWQKVAGDGSGPQRRHNKASPSPVTDGTYVYFYYGSGELVCFDFAGNKIWDRSLEKDFGSFSVQFGYGSSTLLYDGKLYVIVLQRDTPLETGEARESFLLAIDPKTGKDLWRQVRPSDALRESFEAYTTPIPFEGGGRKEILIHGGDYTTGHDAATGKELWRWGSYNPTKISSWRIVPSAVTGDGKIFVSAPKRAPLYALASGATGAVPLNQALWKFDVNPTDVCTPLFYKNRLFVFDGDKHVMTCLDPKTGKVIWSGNTGGKTVYRSSPTGGDGKIYCMNEDGLIVVLDATGDQYKELFRIEMGEGPSRASIALSEGCIFIRTKENLYCIGK
jgi:outer membrane protein assembly factor BamB